MGCTHRFDIFFYRALPYAVIFPPLQGFVGLHSFAGWGFRLLLQTQKSLIKYLKYYLPQHTTAF